MTNRFLIKEEMLQSSSYSQPFLLAFKTSYQINLCVRSRDKSDRLRERERRENTEEDKNKKRGVDQTNNGEEG